MNERSVTYLIVAFVLAEGINVWACWNQPPFSDLSTTGRDQLTRGEKAATIFTLGYGAAASMLTRNVLPLLVAGGFCFAMYSIYEHEYTETKEKKT